MGHAGLPSSACMIVPIPFIPFQGDNCVTGRLLHVQSCHASEAVEAGSEDSVGIDIDDSQWGRKPASIAGNGMDETFRKFAACRRKYMLLYFKLLQATGRFDLLLAAHAFLQSSAHWQNAEIMADMAE